MQNRKPVRFIFLFFLFTVVNTTYAQTATGLVADIPVTDGSFETPNISTGTYLYTPSGAGWNFYANAGIADNNSAFTSSNPNAPAGQQVLFLQQNSAVSRTISFASGAYRFSIKAAQRGTVNGTGQIIRVLVDGIALAQITPSSTSYAIYKTPIYFFSNGNHELKLEGMVTSGDNTALVDDVRWESIPLWSQTTTWQNSVLPSGSATATIPAGFTVALDANNCVGKKVNISGVLTAPLNTNFNLSAECVHVLTGGLLEIGHKTNPYMANGKITLVGSDVTSVQCGSMGTKFIGGMSGSRIELHGKYKKSWSQLNVTADSGSTAITLKEAVNWQVGDRIVIASTDFDMNKAEERTITGVSGDQKTFTLDSYLKNKHFGQLQAYSSTNGQSWTVDERAEVGLLSRNLIVEGDTASDRLAFGGHIMIMQGSVAHIDNVELNRMGQRKILGRYPFHWHLVGNATGQYFNNNSVHHTFNRAITIHGTNNANVRDNVCYDNLGHAIFMEDGNETGNTITGNLGLVTRRPLPGHQLLPSDLPFERNASGPSTFWITHPSNVVQNNRAAGSDGSGFWFAFHQNPKSLAYQPGLNPNILNIPSGYIDNNTAHSSYHGWLIGMAPIQGDTSQTHNFNNDYQPTQSPTITGLTVYKNRLGVYSRIGADKISSTYINMIAADNWEGEANTWVADIRQSLWVGASQNYEPIPGTVSASYNGEGLVTGHTLYDGPVRIYNSHFAGFDRAKFSLFDQWGANIKYHGHSLHNTTVAQGSYHVQFRNNYTGPVWFNASITDVDGIFTGHAMTAIVQDHSILIEPGSVRITPGLRGMESNRRYGYVEVRASDEVYPVIPGQEHNRRQTTQLLRNDGAGWIEAQKEIEGVSLSMILNGVYQYKFIHHKRIPAISRFDYHSMNTGEWVIMEIPNVPSTANVYSGIATNFYEGTGLAALPRVSTLSALQTYNGTAAAYIGNSMFLRFQAPAGNDFRNRGIVGSLFLCLNGNCANGANHVFPDADGDGASNIGEPLSSPFFIRNDNNVNDLSFDFTAGDAGDWYPGGDFEANILVDNLWFLRAEGFDPSLIRNDLNIDGNKVKYIETRTKCEAPGNYQLFWSTADDNTFNEAKSVIANYSEFNTWQIIQFQVGDHPLWKGKQITALRIDPLGGTGKHTWFDWIKAKNTWIFAINKTGGTSTTLQRLDGGGNESKVATLIKGTALGQTDVTWSFDLTDWNNDGYTDIAAFKKQATGSGFFEIHVLDGKTNYQSFLFQSATALTYTHLNNHICVGDYNGDKKADIWCISHNASSSNMTEIHIVDGNNPQSFLLHDVTGLPLVPNTINDFAVHDYDGDQLPDLWYIQKQGMSGKTEIHILKNTGDGNTFNNFSAHITSVLGSTDANWSFDVADYNRDGAVDLIGINRLGADSKTDVHILNGATGFQNFLLQVNSELPTGTANYAYLVDDGTRATGLGYAGAPPISFATGIADETSKTGEVLLYPNPAKDELYIHLGERAGDALELIVTPINGASASLTRMYKTTDAGIRIPLDELSSGVYIVRLNFTNESITRKLIITK